jgi:DNA anti-recombination protein RmuC
MRNRLLLLLSIGLLSPAAFAGVGIQTVLNDKLTMFFILTNVLLTCYFAGWKFDRFAVQHGPEILTTVGILGCFSGISWAMLDFDPGNVSKSVPYLLEGVKTAFLASVSGVLGSLIIRYRHNRQKTPIPQVEGAPKGATMDDMVAAIYGLQKSLSGQEEGSLLSQLKLMRQDQNEQLKGLRTSFETFANKMAKDGSQALIEALKEVIRDFNAKINEQFGDNFKQLNAAVEKLVVWQRQYKDELDKLQSMQKVSAIEIHKAAAHLSLIVQKSESFATTAGSLDTLLRSLAQQYELIEKGQASMAVVLAEMKDVTPMFSKKLDELAQGMKSGVAQVQSDVSEVVRQFGTQVETMTIGISKQVGTMTTGVSKVQSDVSEVVRNFGVQVQSSSAEMKQLLADTLKKSQKDVNDELTKGLETIRQGVITLDRGLQEELTKSLDTLGRQLASLSEKFVADYNPLTDKLREVVRLAAGR